MTTDQGRSDWLVFTALGGIALVDARRGRLTLRTRRATGAAS
jgi:hypothetical protein